MKTLSVAGNSFFCGLNYTHLKVIQLNQIRGDLCFLPYGLPHWQNR